MPGVTALAMSRNAARAGAISGEWNACETVSGVTVAPRSASVRVTRSTASAGPDTTVDRGPFAAARLHACSSASRGRCRRRPCRRRHRTAGGQLLQQPAARNHQSCSVFEGQHLCEDRGGELAHAVADDERGLGVKLAQRGADRVGDGEQSRLRIPGLINVGLSENIRFSNPPDTPRVRSTAVAAPVSAVR